MIHAMLARAVATPAPPETIAISMARVIRIQRSDSGGTITIITIDKGRKHGVTRAWTGEIVDRQGNRVSASFSLLRVSRRRSVAKVSLTPDQVKIRRRVRLMAPAVP